MKNLIATMQWVLVLGVFCVLPSGAQTENGKTQGPSATKTQTSATDTSSGFKDDREKTSYALGMRLALELKSLKKGFDYDPDMIVQGLKDSLEGSKARLT